MPHAKGEVNTVGPGEAVKRLQAELRGFLLFAADRAPEILTILQTTPRPATSGDR